MDVAIRININPQDWHLADVSVFCINREMSVSWR